MNTSLQQQEQQKSTYDTQEGSTEQFQPEVMTIPAATTLPPHLDEAKLVPRFSALRVDIIERACLREAGGMGMRKDKKTTFQDFILELREMAGDPITASTHARIRYFDDRRVLQRQRAKTLKPNMVLSPVCCIVPGPKMWIQCLFTADQWCAAVSGLLAAYSRSVE